MTPDIQSQENPQAAPDASVQPGPRVVPGRECGTCTLCCKVMAIDELGKPPGVWCQHIVRNKGCKIYETRPAECRSFYCHWMLEKSLPAEWKPERAKFALVVNAGGHVTAFVDPGFPGAWRSEPYYGVFKRWAAEGVRASPARLVLARIGTRGVVILPDREIDVGTVTANMTLQLDATPDGQISVRKLLRETQEGAAP